MTPAYDALVVVSFGGPEGPDDVMPFLANVTRGRDVPAERLAEVAATYAQFGGVSPINAHNRQLVAAVQAELERAGPRLPVYWGNRNWHPLLEDAVRSMQADGVRRALAFVTSAFSSYSGCRQYREDIERARAAVGAGAPTIDKLRVFFNHPGFLEPVAARVRAALNELSSDNRQGAHLLFTAHSIPRSMAATSDYEAQLRDAADVVAGLAGGHHPWSLVYQSRSGPPSVPWLEPDVGDALVALAPLGSPSAVVVPLGFVCDHMEVVYDLDRVALPRARAAGVECVRAATVGDDPAFVSMIAELARERTDPSATPRRSLGRLGPRTDVCDEGCCPAPTSGAR